MALLRKKEFKSTRIAIVFFAAGILFVTSFTSFASNGNGTQVSMGSKNVNQGVGNGNAYNNSKNSKPNIDQGKVNFNGQGNVNNKRETSKNEKRNVAVNIVLKNRITSSDLIVLSEFGEVTSKIESINALTMRTSYGEIKKILDLGIVASLNEDAQREAIPLETLGNPVELSMATPRGTWDLDMINVTNGTGASATREVSQTGAGTYIAVIDTGLLKTWRNYFNTDNIAVEYGAAFGGGGGERGTVSRQPNKWELDQDSHGTHVTSTILGYKYIARDNTRFQVNGVAPDAKIIPVKSLNQNGSGWSSVVAAGITYVADLKKGPLANYPVVINMSLGGPSLDGVEKAAIDYAISQGVVVVASAGNSGIKGMGYPGAYAPVISVAASGWTNEWLGYPSDRSWWYDFDVAENGTTDAYITTFSSREKTNQQLDVAAPGSWILGPYQTNGQLSWYFLGGTSMASPHVAGVAALMLQKNKNLSQLAVESILKSTAMPFTAYSASILSPRTLAFSNVTWGTDATGSGLINAKAAVNAVSIP